MKRLILIFVLSGACWAQPTLIDHKTCGATSGTSCTTTPFSSAVVAGQHVVACEGANSTGTLNTPTMTGETFTEIVPVRVTASPSGMKCFEIVSAVGGQTTVSGSMTGCSGCGFHLHAWVQSASTLDQTGTLANNGSSPFTITSGSTTTANELVIAFYYDDNEQITYVAGAGYSILDNTSLSNGNSGGNEQKTVSATGAQTATITGPTTSTSGGIMTFKATAAPTPTPAINVSTTNILLKPGTQVRPGTQIRIH